jgi:hypothetical protein
MENSGKKWTNIEDNQLITEINDKKSYDEIALNHKRSKYAIILRVISNIIYPKYYNDNDNDNGNDNGNNNYNDNDNDNDNDNGNDNGNNNDNDNDEFISKEYNIDINLLKKNINNIKIKNSIRNNRKEEKGKEEKGKEIKINYNEKILEQLLLINKKLDKLLKY